MTAPVKLHVAADEGSGDPLVLLHGWPQDSTMWRRVIPRLSGTYRCIALDLRGLGKSPAPADGYDKEQFARDVLFTLDELGIDRFRVMGHDWGAITAQLMCIEAPSRIRGAIVLDVPSLFRRSYDPRQLLGFLHMPILATAGRSVAPALAARIMKASRVPADDIAHYRAMLGEPERRHVSQRIYRAALLEDMPSFLRQQRQRPDVPMLFLGGKGDPVVRWAPDVELVRGTHFLPDNDPDLVAERALAFFATT